MMCAKKKSSASGKSQIKSIGVLTSGGDAPGMNAAIRAVVRSGIQMGWEVYGIRSGFSGLLAEDFVSLGPRDVSGIIQQGGTVLKSARAAEFKQESVQHHALKILRAHHIEGLIVIGGNGSHAGAHALASRGFPVIALGATIDNDVFGTEVAIGVDTALNIALEAIDRLKVTAASHERAFLLEVMGRNCGYLALVAGIAGGAEAVVIPELDLEPEVVADELRGAYERGHAHAIAVVAEGARHNADDLELYFRNHGRRLGFELRTTKLGHVQRGGTPGVFDRLLASQLGAAACYHLDRGEQGITVGLMNGRVTATPLSEVIVKDNPLPAGLLDVYRLLAI
jgi:6-phosphofructokinase 1